MSDVLGDRGQSIAMLRLTDLEAGAPLFRPHFLGDKWPFVDFLVQLEGVGRRAAFFFAQVKATTRGFNDRGRLRVAMSKEQVAGMSAYSIPTYVIGVDERGEDAYIAALRPRASGFSSMTARHPMTSANRKKLWNEVNAYWQMQTAPPASEFLDPDWSRP